MDWFDFRFSDGKPVPLVGRILIDIPVSDGLWETIRAEPKDAVTWLIQITDARFFSSSLPDDMRPPNQRNPEGGLPGNVWVGGHIDRVWPEILDVRPRVRFLIIDDSTPLLLLEEALGAWRCSNCGRRGEAPRPKHCPHAAHLCGDAPLLAQIHWIVDLGADGPADDYLRGVVSKAGAVYWPGEFPRG